MEQNLSLNALSNISQRVEHFAFKVMVDYKVERDSQIDILNIYKPLFNVCNDTLRSQMKSTQDTAFMISWTRFI